jgi:predicted phosphate transport protein (TIGR00153 family)
MLFSKLLPSNDNFFELFNQHAQRTVETAQGLSNFIEHYDNPALKQENAKKIDDAERAADRITHEVNRILHKTFITPIDRDQIHRLINTMDDIADSIQDSAEVLMLYNVEKITPEIKNLAELSLRSCNRVQYAISLLSKINQSNTAEAILKTCEEIDLLESDADRVMRSAMSALFRDENDVKNLIKLKAIYELLETITDNCEDVANIIEGIVLENS